MGLSARRSWEGNWIAFQAGPSKSKVEEVQIHYGIVVNFCLNIHLNPWWKVFLPFLLGSPQILFPARSCCVPDGCHQNWAAAAVLVMELSCGATNTPTMATKGIHQEWGKGTACPWSFEESLHHMPQPKRNLNFSSLCTSQGVSLVSLASPSHGESVWWGRKHNYWILRGADNVSNSLQKILGLRNLINGSYWGHD